MRRVGLICAGLLLICSVVRGDGQIELTGRVLDAEGRGVRDARVALFWTERVGSLSTSSYSTTDPEGRYRLTLHSHDGQPHALYAVDVDQERGGIAPIRSVASLDISLRPLVSVRGTFFVEQVGPELSWRTLWVRQGGARVASSMGKNGEFSLKLPPGRYELEAHASHDHRRWTQALELDGERVEHLLGEVALEATPLARAYGRPLPGLAPTEVRGLPPSAEGQAKVDLDALLGRWVLILAWDVRAEASRQKLAELRAFCETHADRRGVFEVLALHTQGVASLAEVEKLLAPHAKRLWGGKPLSIPLLLDGQGETLAAWGWGARELPRVVLLDPDGLVVQGGDEKFLAERLR